MTYYIKIEGNKIVAKYQYIENQIGSLEIANDCLENGFSSCTEDEMADYIAGSYAIIEGVLTDISETPEYLAKQVIKSNIAALGTFTQTLDTKTNNKVIHEFMLDAEYLINAVDFVAQTNSGTLYICAILSSGDIYTYNSVDGVFTKRQNIPFVVALKEDDTDFYIMNSKGVIYKSTDFGVTFSELVTIKSGLGIYNDRVSNETDIANSAYLDYLSALDVDAPTITE